MIIAARQLRCLPLAIVALALLPCAALAMDVQQASPSDETPTQSASAAAGWKAAPLRDLADDPAAADDVFPARPVALLDPNVDGGEIAGQRRMLEDSEGWMPMGPLRELRFDMTWIEANDLAFADLEAWAIFAVPTYSEESPLVFTPGYGLHFIDAETPPLPFLPDHVHDVYLDVMWRHRWWSMPQLTTDVAITPGLYSDFEGNIGSDAFRLGARVAGDYMVRPDLVIRAGLAFLDREDVPVLPLGGVIWKPDPDTTWELVLPKPRYVRRFYCDGCTERWWYVGGEFGGGSWAFETPAGTQDVLNYSDWRLVLGVKQKTRGGAMMLFEAGFVFNRDLELESGAEFDPDNALMLRAGIGF
jgi:hypothetical protein